LRTVWLAMAHVTVALVVLQHDANLKKTGAQLA
jgi:hypothetical protein